MVCTLTEEPGPLWLCPLADAVRMGAANRATHHHQSSSRHDVTAICQPVTQSCRLHQVCNQCGRLEACIALLSLCNCAGLNRHQAEALTRHVTNMILSQATFNKGLFVTKGELDRAIVQVEARQKQFQQELQVAHQVQLVLPADISLAHCLQLTRLDEESKSNVLAQVVVRLADRSKVLARWIHVRTGGSASCKPVCQSCVCMIRVIGLRLHCRCTMVP